MFLQVSFEIRYSSSITLQLRLVPEISSTSQKRAIKSCKWTFFGSRFEPLPFDRELLPFKTCSFLIATHVVVYIYTRHTDTHTSILGTLLHNKPFGQKTLISVIISDDFIDGISGVLPNNPIEEVGGKSHTTSRLCPGVFRAVPGSGNLWYTPKQWLFKF